MVSQREQTVQRWCETKIQKWKVETHSYTANSSYYALQQFIDYVHKSKDLSIIHINCRILNANFTNLNILLETLDFSFDVIGLTETWLNESNADVFQLE